ncbi:MAG: hypothetical protein ACRYFX_04900 [Janthinobacterium lividum]
MKIRNKLKKLLQEAGIKSMVPTDELLEKLGGMTIHRFNQILNNDSKTELSLLEVSYLKKWLAEVTNQSEDTIDLVEGKEVPA